MKHGKGGIAHLARWVVLWLSWDRVYGREEARYRARSGLLLHLEGLRYP